MSKASIVQNVYGPVDLNEPADDLTKDIEAGIPREFAIPSNLCQLATRILELDGHHLSGDHHTAANPEYYGDEASISNHGAYSGLPTTIHTASADHALSFIRG